MQRYTVAKVAFSELLLDRKLLPETIRFSVVRISERISCVVNYRNLVSFVQLTPVVPSNECVVYKGPIGRKILQDSDRPTTLVLVEQQAMPVRDDRVI